MKFAPFYDNGSSLCCRIDEKDVENILKDKMRFEALIYTKSTSAIGYENERPIRHFDLLSKIKIGYSIQIDPVMEKIKNNINEDSVNKLLNAFGNDTISVEIKKLLRLFLLKRKERMINIWEGDNLD